MRQIVKFYMSLGYIRLSQNQPKSLKSDIVALHLYIINLYPPNKGSHWVQKQYNSKEENKHDKNNNRG